MGSSYIINLIVIVDLFGIISPRVGTIVELFLVSCNRYLYLLFANAQLPVGRQAHLVGDIIIVFASENYVLFPLFQITKIEKLFFKFSYYQI